MPPARKNVYPSHIVAKIDSKRPRPFHVVNIQDLRLSENDNNQFHLVLKVNKSTPKEVSIKRSGNTLTVESKSEDDLHEGGGVNEPIVRRYEIPEGGYTEELGAQLSADGLLSVRGPGKTQMSGRVIPISVDRLKQLKPGTIVHLNTMSDFQAEGLINFGPLAADKEMMQIKKDGNSAEPNEEQKMTEKDDGDLSENAGQDADVPGANPEDQSVQVDENRA